MRRTVLALAGLLAATSPAAPTAVAQEFPTPAPIDAILARTSACAVGPDLAGIAGGASAWDGVELSRRDALRLQALPDRKAVVRAWTVNGPAAPTYLLVETTETPRPRRLTCELIFPEPGAGIVEAALAERGVGDQPLRAPRLRGPLPTGGRFIEWAGPEGSGWRLVTYLAPLPPKKGPHLSRIRFSGVEP